MAYYPYLYLYIYSKRYIFSLNLLFLACLCVRESVACLECGDGLAGCTLFLASIIYLPVLSTVLILERLFY